MGGGLNIKFATGCIYLIHKINELQFFEEKHYYSYVIYGNLI